MELKYNGTKYFINHIVDNVKKLKKLNGGEVIKKVQERHPDLSDSTKTILERINKSKGWFGLFG